MMKLNAWRKIGGLLVVGAVMAIGAEAQTFNTLFNFDGANGMEPDEPIVQSQDGSLYSMTLVGGTNDNCSFGCGTIFKINRGGTLTTLYNFCSQPNCADGEVPSDMLLAADGNFYGTTVNGGNCASECGTVFKMSPAGALATLYAFCSQPNCSDSEYPYGLIQATDGNFYGTTGGGTIFKITSQGTLTTLHTFDGTDGQQPSTGMIQASDGNFYGTSSFGGSGSGCNTIGCGTVFKLTPQGTLTTLHNFDFYADGAHPFAGVVQGSDGDFYGTTYSGGIESVRCGTNGCGTLFKITSAGVFTTLHSFDGYDGSAPGAGLIQATDGNFYGTTSLGGDLSCDATSGCGTVFALTPEGALTTLHDFVRTDGALVYGGLFQATNGKFYGTTYAGGNNNYCGQSGCGTVFSLNTGLGPFVAFVRGSGQVGQTGGILGQGFTGTTSVSLNGIPASFTVRSDTYLTATVPEGATSGFVTVVTPSGTLISDKPFQVMP